MGQISLTDSNIEMKGTPCFYLPKTLFAQQYAAFSTESKLLFAMIFTNAQHTKAIYEVASLIERISETELVEMRNQLLAAGANKEGEQYV